MRSGRAILAAAAFAAAMAGPAEALTIKHLFKTPPLTYSPNQVAQGAGTIRVSADGYVGPFSVDFTELSMSPLPSPPAERLSYGLYKPAASPTYELSLDGTPEGANEVLSGSFAAGGATRVDIDYAALVKPLTLPPPGTYTATIVARLYAAAFPSAGATTDSASFTLTVTVGSHYDLSVVAAGSPFALSATSAALAFGTLTAYDYRGADVLVRANVSYSLSVASAAGGSLLNAADGSLVP